MGHWYQQTMPPKPAMPITIALSLAKDAGLAKDVNTH